ncbi:hypothetical protein ACFOWZ_37695 [Lentzea rhizosphaerae]|jgi:hypothetical protein|uniref:Secreted protein n=1 Tax=Lentzea rhizosphaerae TaxID=2041025 RepID=A0ABV8C598_9PSEU
MRRLVGVLGISAALAMSGTGVATAAAWTWIGPYPTMAECEISEQGFRDAGHLTAGCGYRDLAYPWQDGYYFPAWPVE